MNLFIKSIRQVITGAIKTFEVYPAAIVSALGFAIVTLVRIQLDWPQQEDYNFLFNCLHWSFALGAAFSLAAILAANSRYNDKKSFNIANMLGLAVVIVTFLLLYQFGATDSAAEGLRYVRVTGIAAARVGVGILISLVAFVVLAAHPKEQSDFQRSFFMFHKAFFVALIYGAVIMSGTSGVAGAVEVLIYEQMSEKVYQYIATAVGFLAFTIFVGYFPDFRKDVADEKREIAQKQPRFVEVLFDYIMIPIALAMTVVLCIWAGKTIISASGYSFVQLSSIATSYAIGGIWLHIMVTSHETGLAKFYRKIYPMAALVILGFEAWAWVLQLNKFGLKGAEYAFLMIWVIAVAAVILLLVIKAKSHKVIAAIACTVAVFSVLPALGYLDLPVSSQISRVEALLIGENMLKDDKLIPAAREPELAVRESITDGINYLSYSESAKLPAWFDKKFAQGNTFKETFGFEQVWPKPEYPEMGGYQGTSLMLPTGAVDISGYRWAVKLSEFKEGPQTTAVVEGEKGTYKITWSVSQPDNIPSLNVQLNDKVILQQSMNDYVDRISEKFPPGKTRPTVGTLEDMSLAIETAEVEILLVFGNVDINVDNQNDVINYWINLSDLFMREKP